MASSDRRQGLCNRRNVGAETSPVKQCDEREQARENRLRVRRDKRGRAGLGSTIAGVSNSCEIAEARKENCFRNAADVTFIACMR